MRKGGGERAALAPRNNMTNHSGAPREPFDFFNRKALGFGYLL